MNNPNRNKLTENREQTDGCQTEEMLKGWVKKVKGLRTTIWQYKIVTGI